MNIITGIGGIAATLGSLVPSCTTDSTGTTYSARSSCDTIEVVVVGYHGTPARGGINVFPTVGDPYSHQVTVNESSTVSLHEILPVDGSQANRWRVLIFDGAVQLWDSGDQYSAPC